MSFRDFGVRNLFKYSKCYSGKEPEFAEGDIFRIVVPLHDDYVKYTTQAMQRTTQVVQETTQAMQKTTQAKQEPTQATENTTQDPQDTTQLADRVLLESNSEKDQIKRLMLYGIKMNEYMTKRNIVDLIRKEPEISQKQIAERLNLNLNTTKYYIRKLKESGIIEREGSPQKGKWIVREQEN